MCYKYPGPLSLIAFAFFCKLNALIDFKNETFCTPSSTSSNSLKSSKLNRPLEFLVDVGRARFSMDFVIRVSALQDIAASKFFFRELDGGMAIEGRTWHILAESAFFGDSSIIEVSAPLLELTLRIAGTKVVLERLAFSRSVPMDLLQRSPSFFSLGLPIELFSSIILFMLDSVVLGSDTSSIPALLLEFPVVKKLGLRDGVWLISRLARSSRMCCSDIL